jgi:peptide deformylase
MAVVPIRRFGDPVLRNSTEAVRNFDGDLRKLVRDMIDTMYAAPGIGLAANQIGVSRRVAVIDLSVGEHPDQVIVMVNPEIISREGEITEEEGCLSVPEFTEMVSRPDRVKMRFQNLEGKPQEMEGEGLLARAFAHEVDHLNGNLYLDYLRGLKKERILKKIQKLVKAGEW